MNVNRYVTTLPDAQGRFLLRRQLHRRSGEHGQQKKTVARSGSLQHPVREIFLTTGCFERILTYDSLFLPRNYQQNEVPPSMKRKAPLIDTSLLNSRLILILLQRLAEDEIVEEVDELIDLRLRDLARSTELIALDAHLFTDE